MDLGLQGRVVLVTGSNRGIGRAIARSAAAEGAIVAMCGRTEELGLEAVAELGEDRASWFTAELPAECSVAEWCGPWPEAFDGDPA